jgi:hypothetical protein
MNHKEQKPHDSGSPSYGSPIPKLSGTPHGRQYRTKNWRHEGNREAGLRVAAILSVVESCRRLGIPVREYLSEVLPGLADRKASEVGALTPMAWKGQRSG